MHKNLNTTALGVSGRQSELIELALTYGFRGLDLDMADVVKRVRSRGIDSARRFVASASVSVGCFELPIDWRGDETSFRSSLVELKEIAEIASALGAHGCIATVRPSGSELPYHENFEFHRHRLAEMAGVLEAHEIKLGLAFQAAAEHREGDASPFIHQAEALLTLIKTIGSNNVGLAFDAWNWFVGGGGMDQLGEVARDQIVSVRLADVPPDADLSTVTEQDRELPSEEGLIDCAGIMRHFGEIEYEGPVTLYPHPRRFIGMTRDAIVQRASVTLDKLWKSAGLNREGKLDAAPVQAE